ncbi:MAG: hypothetical protein GXZ03_09865 [Proteiniphilum sp.]|nr:hypothetical protein [Proteiniphilum sp.]
MKKYYLIVCAVMFTFSLSMSAQNRQGKQGNGNRDRQTMQMTAKDRVEAMSKVIELTDAQKTEIEELYKKQDAKRAEDMAKMKENRDKLSGDRDKMREEMRTMRDAEMKKNQEELEKIIGKEKSEKLDAIRKTRMSNNRQGRRN